MGIAHQRKIIEPRAVGDAHPYNLCLHCEERQRGGHLLGGGVHALMAKDAVIATAAKGTASTGKAWHDLAMQDERYAEGSVIPRTMPSCTQRLSMPAAWAGACSSSTHSHRPWHRSGKLTPSSRASRPQASSTLSERK